MTNHPTKDRREPFGRGVLGCVSGLSVTFQNNRLRWINIVPDKNPEFAGKVRYRINRGCEFNAPTAALETNASHNSGSQGQRPTDPHSLPKARQANTLTTNLRRLAIETLRLLRSER